MAAVSSKAVRAVVLAAGQGKRMKSGRPKVLHEVLGRAILSRVLDALDKLSLEHIHIVTGHESHQVCRHLDTHAPQKPWSTTEQQRQLGTGHALAQMISVLDGFAGTLLVTVADTPLLTAETLRRLAEEHHRQGAAVTLLSTLVDDAKSYGRIVRDGKGNIVKIVESKDATAEQKNIAEINTGIYCFAWPDIVAGLNSLTMENKQKEYYLTDLAAWAVSSGRAVASVVAGDWHEVAGVNSRLDLSEAIRLMAERTAAKLSLESGVTVVAPGSTWIAPEVKAGQDTVILPGCYLEGDIDIGQNCSIGPGTVMYGPVKVGSGTTITQSLIVNCEIGSQCRVGPFAHLRDKAQVGDAVRIGNFVEIKKSSIGRQTNVSHLSYVGDASVGTAANLGAGTITANYNHITKRKEKTVIGDNAATGSNTVLVAPVKVGDGASVAAGTVVTKDVPAGSLALGRARQENKTGWADNKRKQASSDASKH